MTLTPVKLALMDCEKAIENHLADAAFSLRKIRDEKLYVEEHKTFEAYCRDRWTMARATAYQMIEHANTIDAIHAAECLQIADIGDEPVALPMPTSEGQTRPLSKLEPKDRAAAWTEAVIEAHDQGKAAPTGKIVNEIVQRREKAGTAKPPPKRKEQSDKHPATFSKALIDVFVDVLANEVAVGSRILDPFAGPGGVHDVADKLGIDSIGVEIQQKWAELHERNICADSTTITRALVGTFDVVLTSPTYGNRMADHHDAKDASHRDTYTHTHGSPLEPNNTGTMKWDDPEYRKLHRDVYRRAVRLLEDGGLFVLNVKDHVRNGIRQPVSGWHLGALVKLGLVPIDDASIYSKGLAGSGDNAETRQGIEHVYLLRKDRN